MDVKQIVDVDRLSKHFDKIGEFMDGVFGELSGTSTFGGNPEQAGIRVTKSKGDESPMVVIEIEVPGCTSSEVVVEMTSGRLVARWTPKMSGKEQVRTFSLSDNTDADGVSAKVKDGYLTITIPGVSEKTRTRKVSVG